MPEHEKKEMQFHLRRIIEKRDVKNTRVTYGHIQMEGKW